MADLIYDGATVIKTYRQGILRALEEAIAEHLVRGGAVRVQIGSSDPDNWSLTIFVGPSTPLQFIYEGENPPQPNERFLHALRQSHEKFGYLRYPSEQEIIAFDGKSPVVG